MNGWAQREAERQEDEEQENCQLRDRIASLRKTLSIVRGSIAMMEEAGVFKNNALDMKVVAAIKKRIDREI